MATADWDKKTSDVPEESRRQWRADRALRPAMRSPGRPEPSRAVQRQFWRAIATGVTTAEAVVSSCWRYASDFIGRADRPLSVVRGA